MEDVCYLCHVKAHAYKGKGVTFTPDIQEFTNNLPEKFKNEKNVSWLVFDLMQRIPIDFIL